MKYILFIALLLSFAGCATDPLTDETITGNRKIVNPLTVTNESGQIVKTIDYNDFFTWIKENKTIFIYSISPIDRGGHGYTIGYIVVYKELSDVESSARNAALEKLTPEEKKLLGIK